MLKLYLWSFSVSLILSLIFTPLAKRLAVRFKIYGRTEGDKIHSYLVPRWGGVGIFLAFLFSLGTLFLNSHFRLFFSYKNNLIIQEFIGILIGASIVVVLGVIDDKERVDIASRFLVQVIAALVVLNCGVKISGISLPFLKDFLSFSILVSSFLTILWLVAFINAINLADGIDGLASGLVAIVSLIFLLVAILLIEINPATIVTERLRLVSILCSVLGGTCIGFLFYNFSPAKILLGNSGKMFLGFMLGSITVVGGLKTTAVISLFIPLIIIGLPFLNVFFVIFRRPKKMTPLLKTGKGHLHYQLLKSGWTQREIVFMMYFISTLLGIISILMVIFRYIIAK